LDFESWILNFEFWIGKLGGELQAVSDCLKHLLNGASSSLTAKRRDGGQVWSSIQNPKSEIQNALTPLQSSMYVSWRRNRSSDRPRFAL
jgi:hypothetical protein